ncbi:Crp/Fnr family transcriptional regulator [Flavobacterium ardleyense]|uniref:Crp/Fnr family transcriptional regulator n=1 Tax=Flavobacterium ardleyense TaxID=2038737 RepID=UPI003873A9D1
MIGKERTNLISVSLLESVDAKKILLKKGDILFREGQKSNFYYQVISGEIKMNNFNDEGKEFIQGIFTAGKSFGEPPLLCDLTYPANAEALTDAELYTVEKKAFFELLLANPDVNLSISQYLAERLYYKSIMATEISTHEPEHRILKLIDYLKSQDKISLDTKYRVELTRQQIADLTGLRVETVIRAVKSLERKKELQIEDRKIFR